MKRMKTTTNTGAADGTTAARSALYAALLHCAAVQARAANANGRDSGHRPSYRRPSAPFHYDSRDLATVLAASGVL